MPSWYRRGIVRAAGERLPEARIARSFRGAAVFMDTPWGRNAQAWPRKRGKPKSPTTKTQNKDFKRLVDVVKQIPDADKIAARMIAEGSGYTWRDVLSRAATGNLFEPIPVPTEFLMGLLDQISDIPGAMLYRGEDAWFYVAPGTDGQFLRFDEASLAPYWYTVPPPPGGGSGGVLTVPMTFLTAKQSIFGGTQQAFLSDQTYSPAAHEVWGFQAHVPMTGTSIVDMALVLYNQADDAGYYFQISGFSNNQRIYRYEPSSYTGIIDVSSNAANSVGEKYYDIKAAFSAAGTRHMFNQVGMPSVADAISSSKDLIGKTCHVAIVTPASTSADINGTLGRVYPPP